MTPQAAAGLKKLTEILKEMDSVLVAFSGGVDSSLLLQAAADELKDKVTAVTATGELYDSEETEAARDLARKLGVELLTVNSPALADPAFTLNPRNRCYICKKALFTSFKELARARGLKHVADGTNLDDLNDYRPGNAALKELRIRQPLMEAGLTKAHIRALARELNLPNWDKPANPCLATRFPYGSRITPEALKRVQQSERFIRSLGFSIVRVRLHGHTARIEVPREKINLLLDENTRLQISRFLHDQGITQVSVDLDGYRSGSLDEI